jgi:hypothetical protein
MYLSRRVYTVYSLRTNSKSVHFKITILCTIKITTNCVVLRVLGTFGGHGTGLSIVVHVVHHIMMYID